MTQKAPELWFALDVDTLHDVNAYAIDLVGVVDVFKVGMQLFTNCGPAVIRELKKKNHRVFLDLKYHDIPNTVAGAVRAAVRLRVDYVSIHASGGAEMIHAAAREVEGTDTKLLAITLLTSLNDTALGDEMHVGLDRINYVVELAMMAYDCGADGVVASLHEAICVRKTLGDDALIVTPGIRPTQSNDDQARTGTPQQAREAGCSAIVVGRPIRLAHNPHATAVLIKDQLTGK